MASSPRSSRAVGAENKSDRSDEEEDRYGDDCVGSAPRRVCREVVLDERLEERDPGRVKNNVRSRIKMGMERKVAHMTTKVTPPPRLPQPPTRALAVPTMFYDEGGIRHVLNRGERENSTPYRRNRWSKSDRERLRKAFKPSPPIRTTSRATRNVQVPPRMPIKNRTAYRPAQKQKRTSVACYKEKEGLVLLTVRVLDQPGHARRNGARDQHGGHAFPRAVPITHRSHGEPYKQSSKEGDHLHAE